MKLIPLLILTISLNLLYTNEYSDKVYDSISNISSPSYDEYLLVENYLTSGTIPYIYRMIDWRNRPLKRGIKLVNASLDSIKYSIINVKNKKKSKEKCIILYASFDDNQSNNINNLVNEIKDSNYKGDIIKRIGGWPNIEEGDLRLAHIPGAYKVCAFREALRLGYKKALWIDCNFLPEISLNTIFDRIEEFGIFTYKTQFSLLDLCKRGEHISSFNMPKHLAKDIYIVHSGILGIDLESSTNLNLISQWYETTVNQEVSSFTPFSVYSLFSFLLQQYYDPEIFPYTIDYIDSQDHRNLEFSRQ